jgi:hypothetical protein
MLLVTAVQVVAVQTRVVMAAPERKAFTPQEDLVDRRAAELLEAVAVALEWATEETAEYITCRHRQQAQRILALVEAVELPVSLEQPERRVTSTFIICTSNAAKTDT